MIKIKSWFILLIQLILLSILTSCGSEPEPINYGTDECEFCRMLITDNRYGAEVITDKGKIYKFDSIECLIDFALAKNLIGDENQTFLVTDFASPGSLINCETAFFVHNENFRSPMGLNVSTFGTHDPKQKFVSANGGKELSWMEVIVMVKHTGM